MFPSASKEEQFFSVGQILSEVITFCTGNQLALFNSLKHPGLGILFLALFSTDEFGLLTILLMTLNIYFYTVFTVRCHRLFLLNELSDSLKESLFWGKRNTKFMFASIGLSSGIVILFVPIIFIIFVMNNFFVSQDFLSEYLLYIIIIPFCYLFSRLSLVFPEIAIDKEYGFHRAWKLSSGNGWKLFFLTSIIPIVESIIIVNINSEQVLFKLVTATLGILVLTFEIIILSNSYKKLTKIWSEKQVDQS